MKGVDATNEFVLDTAVPVLVPPEPSTPIFYSKNKEARTERTCISRLRRGATTQFGRFLFFFPLPPVRYPLFRSSSPLLSSPLIWSLGVRPSLSSSHIHRNGNERKRNEERERKREREKRGRKCARGSSSGG